MKATNHEESPPLTRHPFVSGMLPWTLMGCLLFAAGLYSSIAAGGVLGDEGWFLQVMNRLESGEVLYRDVFFGATPLSVYVAQPFTRFFGTEVVVIKALVTLSSVLTILVCCWINRRLGSSQDIPLLFVLALVFPALPGRTGVALYSPLADLFLVACFGATLRWLEGEQASENLRCGNQESSRWLVIAAVAAGLSFGSKQNLGIYALLALLGAVIVHFRSLRKGQEKPWLAIFAVLGAFVVSSALVLLPVWWSGGTEKLLDYGFLNKPSYVRSAWISYGEGFRDQLAFSTHLTLIDKLKRIFWCPMFLLLPATLTALLSAWRRLKPREHPRAAIVTLFVAVSCLGIFPRMDLTHLGYAAPVLITGLAYAGRQIDPRWARRWIGFFRAGLFLWLAGGVAYILVNPFVELARGNSRVSDLPHFRGVLMKVSVESVLRAHTKAIKEAANNNTLFILSPFASFYYLAADLKNPTAFDYPLTSAFGRPGQADTIAAISQGRIRTICCWKPLETGPLAPSLLKEYVLKYMTPGRDLGACTLYHARGQGRD